jgi:hypothetical protein
MTFHDQLSEFFGTEPLSGGDIWYFLKEKYLLTNGLTLGDITEFCEWPCLKERRVVTEATLFTNYDQKVAAKSRSDYPPG